MPTHTTYDATAIATTPLFQVRFLIGDTRVTGDVFLFDEEILFAIQMRPVVSGGFPYGAAADCARAIAARFSRDIDTVQGEMRTLYSSRQKAYAARAIELEAIAASRAGAMPYAGGISQIDKSNAVMDGDRVVPAFNIGEEDNFLPVGPVGNVTPGSPPNDGSGGNIWWP
jgi:hypothetical protein